MPRSHEIIVQSVLNHLRSNIAEPLTLASVAKLVGCSKSWLIEIFMRSTGKGPITHLIELRIQKAKELLQNTDLSISEIASACGFSGHTYFSTAFQKTVKLSPSGFRKHARSALDGGEASRAEHTTRRVWFSDTMQKDALTGRWKPREGNWTQESDCVTGTGEENVSLELRKLLPDNFHLSFEVRLEGLRGVPGTMIGIFFSDQTANWHFYTFRIHDLYGVECTLLRRDVPVQESTYAQIKTGVWHKVEIVQNDDSLSLLLDGRERILFRDPFPAPYDKRSRLVVSVWRSRLCLRNVEIEDLGFLPFARTIRQADALYNLGHMQQARQMYQRMLDTEVNPADFTELHCKIGLCFLAENDIGQARDWAEKVSAFPLSDFWAQQAALVLLETDWRENRIPDLLARIAALAQKPAIRCRLNGIVIQAARDFDFRGFFEEGLLLRNTLCDIADEASPQYLACLALVCESLLQLNRLESAVAHLKDLAEPRRVHAHQNEFWLFALVDALNFLGRPNEAIQVIVEMRGRTQDIVTRARCDVYEALCLRAQGKLEDAISLLQAVPANHPKAGVMVAFAKLSTAEILVAIGKPDEALTLVAEVDQCEERNWFMGKGYKSRYEYPALIAKGDYCRAAEVLLLDSAVDDENVSLRARQVLGAAIILSMAGRNEECVRILEETVRRFPEARVRYFASLARALAQGIRNSGSPGWSGAVASCFEKLPYPAPIRSEIFYLAGLLFMHLGEKAAGLALLRRSAEEDPSNLWPAVLAKKKLEEEKLSRSN